MNCWDACIDPVGRPLDRNPSLETALRRPVERDAPPIMDRAPVTVPLQTGLKVVDALIPVGRGQRELILGDRQTGKTAVAHRHDSQPTRTGCNLHLLCDCPADIRRGARRGGIAGIFRDGVLRGGRRRRQFPAGFAIRRSLCRHHDRRVLHGTGAGCAGRSTTTSPPMRGPIGNCRCCSVARRDARRFRAISSMCIRGCWNGPRISAEELGGGSLTALPIAETEAQNVAAYIPTNLISITDGQIYLSPELFRKGMLPAVDVGRICFACGREDPTTGLPPSGGRFAVVLFAI